MKIVAFLQQAYSLKINWRSILLPNIIAGALLFLLAPFGFMVSNWLLRFGFTVLFASFGTLTIMLILSLLKYSGYVDTEKWTLGKECLLSLLIITLIALCNSFLVYIILDLTWSLSKIFWNVGLGTFLVSLVPTIALITYEYYQSQHVLLKNNLDVQAELNKKLTETTLEPSKICFSTEQGKPVLHLLASDILFVKSDGNYIEVFHLTKNIVQQTLIRNRLKVVLAQLPPNIFFYVHKSYIVNHQKIVEIKGNSRRLDIFLRGYKQPIPVSRSKIKALQQLLQQSPTL